jgi:uncharacterized membrane-anchored protein YjiN (DUF445 family)
MMPPGAPPLTEKGDAIRRIRRVATGLLAALAVVYFGTFTLSDPGSWVLLLRAMAEAGMIGGIADWFAVEALFRRPLGLPIPHTALLPRNQKRAANNIARFIDTYFLVPEQLMARVARINPVGLLAGWLSQPDNARRVAAETSRLLQVLVRHQVQRGVGAGTNRAVRTLLKSMVEPQSLSADIASLLKETVRSRFMDDVIATVRSALDGNRDRVIEIAQDRSRWWIPSTADRQMVKVLVDGILSVMDELSDQKSPLRQDFDRSIIGLVDELHGSGRISAFIEEGRERYLDSPEFALALDRVIEAALTRIQDFLEEDRERADALVASAFLEIAAMLRADPAFERDLNARLVAGLGTVLTDLRPAVMAYITEVIETWDSDDLVSRIESEVGHDLQFIRINGAVLGALVGGMLHVMTSFWH